MNGLVWPGALAPVVTGVLVLRWIWPRPVTVSERMLHVALVVLAGFSLHSLWHLLWVLISDGSSLPLGYLAFDLLLPAMLGAAHVVSGSGRPGPSPPARVTFDAGYPALWTAVPLVMGSLALASTVRLAWHQPHGGWDAWAIWNFKARWLTLAGPAWSDVLTNNAFATSHPDYPLLLPLSIARFWLVSGSTGVSVPQWMAVGAAVLVFTLLVASIRSLRGPVPASVAGAAFPAVPLFFEVAASQYADVPLSACYLAALIALAHASLRGARAHWLVAVGLFSGAALWTKNEGVLFAACVVVGSVVAGWLNGLDRRAAATRVGCVIAGAAPFLIAVVVTKLRATPNDLLAGQTLDALWLRGLDPARHGEIVRHGALLLRNLPDHFGIGLLILFAFLRGRAADLAPAAAVLTVIGLTALGYYAVFVLTPMPLSWHLNTAADRLIVQLWPGLVFATLLACSDDGVRLRI